MGLIKRISELGWRWLHTRRSEPTRNRPTVRPRICRFEQIESRRFLSAAPIQIGSVYYEDATQDDQSGDLIEITWSGGAAGTQLAELTIQTDKEANGLNLGDCFFDTASGGLGAYQARPLTLVSRGGIDSVSFSVADGGTTLVFTFQGFDPGERLVFSIDVDEMGFLGPNAVAEGNEWEGTKLTAIFQAPHYADATGSDLYVDYYDSKLAASGLALPPDNYVPPGVDPQPVLTAGAFATIQQIPLPITLSGIVFEDLDGDNVQDAGDPGITGVELTLEQLQGAQYVATTFKATTDSAGAYRFENLLPGTYRVVEAQPSGYVSIGAQAGTVNGVRRGTVASPDMLTDIALEGGDNSIHNDFAEVRPASLCGAVYVDWNNNGLLDADETAIAGVTVYLLDAAGNRVASAVTGEDGRYCFRDLRPGSYGVEEVQPAGYLDGQEQVGTSGGVVSADDRMSQIPLSSGTHAEQYNFGELVGAKISGYVFQDGPAIEYPNGTRPPDALDVLKTRDGQLDPDDRRLSGVVLELRDALGVPVLDAQGRPRTAVTDDQGYYEFTDLLPGVYTIVEVHPAGYMDGLDTPGSKGGIAVNATEPVDPELVASLAIDPGDDAILRIPIDVGDEATDYNFSEILVREGPPASPPEPPPPLPPWLPPTPPPQVAFLEPPTQPGYWERTTPIVLAGGGHAEPGFVLLGGGGSLLLPPFTWHLSVVNAGQPRDDVPDDPMLAAMEGVYFSSVSWSSMELAEAQWILADAEGRPIAQHDFGLPMGIPVTGDWNGEGATRIGVFYDGLWFLDLDGDGRWGSGDLWARLGQLKDRPVTGDWDGDGKTDIGIFGAAWAGDSRAIQHEPGLPDVANRTNPAPRPRYKNIPPSPEEATSGWRTLKRTALGKFRKDLIDHVFRYGDEGDLPITGDWNGDGVTNIGIFHNGTWYLDADGDGRWSSADIEVTLGQAGDVPVVGDWNGDGTDELGVYRDGVWLLDTNGDRVLDAHDKTFRLGEPGDVPVVGDWNADGVDEVGVYRPTRTATTRQASAQPSLHAPQSSNPGLAR